MHIISAGTLKEQFPSEEAEERVRRFIEERTFDTLPTENWFFVPDVTILNDLADWEISLGSPERMREWMKERATKVVRDREEAEKRGDAAETVYAEGGRDAEGRSMKMEGLRKLKMLKARKNLN